VSVPYIYSGSIVLFGLLTSVALAVGGILYGLGWLNPFIFLVVDLDVGLNPSTSAIGAAALPLTFFTRTSFLYSTYISFISDAL
jgi:hypothetical protein